MRALIVGLGSIGRRHSKILKEIDPSIRIAAWRRQNDQIETDSPVELIVTRLEQVLEFSPDVAILTGPASEHTQKGLSLAAEGIHLLIEKPISSRLDGVEELIALCQERTLVLMTGYNLRFHRPLQILKEAVQCGQIGRPQIFRAEVGQYLPEWRPGRDYRETVSAQRELGGGVVLELSHELDCARWIMGEVRTVLGWTGRLSDLEIDVEDVAEAIVEFDNGAIGSIHLDMIQRSAVRRCRVIGSKGSLDWDASTDCLKLKIPANGNEVDLHRGRNMDRNEMYRAELQHFLECVKTKQAPMVDGKEGLETLKLALAVKRSAQKGQRVDL
jgi:predicted dehydrogenase